VTKPIPPKPFTKGDPRINRKGRPKSFDQLRSLAQKLSHEPIIPGEGITAIGAILRKLARENPERLIEIAYGKVPQPVELTGKDGGAEIKIVIEYANDKDNPANPA
jgi:hypothetical protein